MWPVSLAQGSLGSGIVSVRRCRRRNPGQTTGSDVAGRVRPASPEESSDAAWDRLRQGARNVAGVSWQVAVTAYLLVVSRAGDLPFVRFTPEGFEDVDCQAGDGSATFVQMKEVGAGAGRLTAVDVAGALVHVAEAAGEGPVALVTDGDLGSGLRFTGWTEVLADQGGQPVADVIDHLINQGVTDAEAATLVRRARLVSLPWNLRPVTEKLATDAMTVHPTVASFAVGRLYDTLTAAAANQRATSRTTAITHTTGDLDTIIGEVQSAVDLNGLDAAVAAGVCAAADFVHPSDLAPNQFYAGVDGAPGHVAAHLDVIRVKEMAEIVDAVATERYALLLGPSGSGKSVLLWRAARDAILGARIVRVRQLVTSNDVDLLARHVQLLHPSAQAPVVVAADNLGRPMLAQWPEVVERLRELPGVVLLGAVRAEDFNPRIVRGSARIIEMRLDADTAREIARRIDESGIAVRMSPSEAEQRAEGLLMEFIALLTTGRRLEQILAEQVDALRQPGRELQRALARLVTAAHTAGVSVPATALPSAPSMTATPEAIGDALSVLRGEHVLTTDGSAWRGLHELRSQVIAMLLHESPPPTLTQTYAELLPLLPPAAASWVARRAAEQLDDDIRPIAQSLGTMIFAPSITAVDAAILLEGAERADNTLYAKTCLPILRRNLRTGTTLEQLSMLVYPVRNQGTIYGMAQLDQPMRNIANQLPERTSPVASQIVAATGPRLVELVADTSLSTIVRLLEAATDQLTISPTTAATIYHRFKPPADADAADLHARLIAALAAATDADQQQLTEIVGSTAERAEIVTRADPNAISLVVNAPAAMVTATIMYSPYDLSTAATPVWDAPTKTSSDAANEAAMRTARRLADACPELSTFEVITISPSGERWKIADHEPGYKRLDRSQFPPRAGVRRNVGFQAAIRRLTAATSWTELISEQVSLAGEIIVLLKEAPTRLTPTDNARRRAAWQQRLDAVRTRTSTVAARPLTTAPDPGISSAQTDQADRESDATSDALNQLAQALPRLLDGDHRIGIAATLHDVATKIGQARAASDPRLAEIGRPMPQQLTEYLNLLVGLLTVIARDPTAARRIRGSDPQGSGQSILHEVRTTISRQERSSIEALLHNVPEAAIHEVSDPDPLITNIGRHAWLITSPVEHWNETVLALQQLGDDDANRMPSNVMATPLLAGNALPFGIRVAHTGQQPYLPMTADMIRPFTDQLKLSVVTGGAMAVVGELVDALTSLSWHNARDRQRDPAWPPSPAYHGLSLTDIRATAVTQLGPNSLEAEAIRQALETLINHVQTEMDGAATTNLATEILNAATGAASPGTVLQEAITIATTGAIMLTSP